MACGRSPSAAGRTYTVERCISAPLRDLAGVTIICENKGMSSQITLFAQQTGKTGVWQRMSKPDFEGAYSEAQQQENRKQAQAQRQKSTQRTKDTRRKIILGGIWLKYFPELKELDPANEADFKAVAGVMAVLASDPGFLRWWAEQMKKGQG